jgi:hypothetical protein
MTSTRLRTTAITIAPWRASAETRLGPVHPCRLKVDLTKSLNRAQCSLNRSRRKFHRRNEALKDTIQQKFKLKECRAKVDLTNIDRENVIQNHIGQNTRKTWSKSKQI